MENCNVIRCSYVYLEFCMCTSGTLLSGINTAAFIWMCETDLYTEENKSCIAHSNTLEYKILAGCVSLLWTFSFSVFFFNCMRITSKFVLWFQVQNLNNQNPGDLAIYLTKQLFQATVNSTVFIRSQRLMALIHRFSHCCVCEGKYCNGKDQLGI